MYHALRDAGRISQISKLLLRSSVEQMTVHFSRLLLSISARLHTLTHALTYRWHLFGKDFAHDARVMMKKRYLEQ